MVFSELETYEGLFYGYLSVTQVDIMKSILTVLFVVVLSATAIANTSEDHAKVNPIKMDLVLDGGVNGAKLNKKIKIATDKEVARLYRRKNTLIKKALNFRTKRNRSKLA